MNLLTDAKFTQPYDQIKGSYSTLHWPCKEVLCLLSDALEGVRHSHVHGHLLTRLVITELDSICKVVDIFNTITGLNKVHLDGLRGQTYIISCLADSLPNAESHLSLQHHT